MSDQDDAERPGTRIGLAAALFVASAGGLVIEITAGRLLAPYVGMTLYSWTAVIAVVLAGLSAGHWFGGFVADRSLRRQRRGLSLAFFGAAVSSLASLAILNALAEPLLDSDGHVFVTLGLLTGAAFFLPAFFAGVAGPVLTRLAIAGAPERAGRVLGQMFTIGALGAIAGTLASGFLFISWLGSRNTMIAVALLFLMCGLYFLFPLRGASRVERAGLSALVVVGASVAAWGFASKAFVTACRVKNRLLQRKKSLKLSNRLRMPASNASRSRRLCIPNWFLKWPTPKRSAGVWTIAEMFFTAGWY